jgi:hypothetical protein
MRTLIIILAVLGLSSCGNNTNQNKEAVKAVENVTPKAEIASKLNSNGTNKLNLVLNAYYKLKDALVASNSDDATKNATELNNCIDSLKSTVAKDTTMDKNAIASLDSVLLLSKKLAAVAPKDALEAQRVLFEKVSDHLLLFCQKVALKNAGVYVEFCPMAFNDKGAHWLSNTSEIQNPYFGKKMLECGEVTDSLK